MKGIYIVGGYPDFNRFKNVLKLLNDSNVDFVEIGIPFNDPVADGGVISEAINQVVSKGFKISEIIDLAIDMLCNKKVYIMTYSNIVYHFNFNRYFNKIEGLIIADCPFKMHKFFYERGLKIPIVPFIAVNSNIKTIKSIKNSKADFVYFIGIKGTTGGNLNFNKNFYKEKIEKIKKLTSKKVIFGFGLKNKKQINEVLEIADGFVVGTEAVRNQHDLKKFKNFLTIFSWKIKS